MTKRERQYLKMRNDLRKFKNFVKAEMFKHYVISYMELSEQILLYGVPEHDVAPLTP